MEFNLDTQKLIVFRIEDEEFAVSVKNVGAIERILSITRVPGTPSFVKGVINLRGVVTPVIDLKERFHNKSTTFTEESRIIIINVGEIGVGLIVDAANDVIDVSEDLIEPAPEVVGSAVVEYITGVVKLDNRLLILLDLHKVLNTDEIEELHAMEG